MLRFFHVFLLMVFISNSFFSQTREIDSLREIVYSCYGKECESIEQIDNLYEYHKAYLKAVNYDSLFFIADYAKQIAIKLSDLEALAKADIMKGKFYETKKNYRKSINYYKKAREYVKPLDNDEIKLCCAWLVGSSFFNKDYRSGNLDSCLIYYKEVFFYSQSIGKLEEAKSAVRLSQAFLLNGDRDSSMYYSNKILTLLEGENKNEISLYHYVSKMEYYEAIEEKDSALYYGGLSIASLEEINDSSSHMRKIKLRHLIKYSNCLYNFLEYDSAKVLFEKAVHLAIDDNDFSSFYLAFGTLSFIYSVQGDYEKSITISQKAISWGHKIGDSSLIAYAKYSSTFTYVKMKNYDQVINIYKELLSLYENYLPLSVELIYANMTYNYYENKDYVNAVKYGVMAKELDGEEPAILFNLADAYLGAYKDSSIDLRDVLIESYSQNLYVQIFSQAKAKEEVLKLVFENYTSSIALMNKQENKRLIIHPYYGLGDYYDIVGNKEKAAYNYEKAWGYSKGTETIGLVNKIKIANKLYLFYRGIKNEPLLALEWLEKLDSLKTQETEKNNLETVGRKQAEFEYSQKIYFDSLEAKKANEIEQIKLKQKESNRQLVTIFSVVLIVVFSFLMYLFFRRRQLEAKHKMLRLEQKLLRTQMNPHFIFNSLTTIGSFVISNKVQVSYNYITKFSKLIRLILESSRKDEIAIESELLIVENFLALHQINKNENLIYEVNYDKNILEEDIKVPPMLLQPFIENAIEYGEDFETGKNFIFVEFKLDGNRLLLSVRDHGGGFSSKNKKGKHESYAMKITKERILSIKKQLKKSLVLNIVDFSVKGEGEKGVLVEIHVEI